METKLNQRWRDQRGSYRPAGEVIRTSAYEVAAIDDDSTAKAFVTRHHYSGTFPAARFRFGLYTAGGLAGVAVFSQPVNNATLSIFPGEPSGSVELGRFVLLDDVPGNGETWFLARCFEALRREGLTGVVSFSDPMQRETSDGEVVFGGHVGTIYQAFNAVYMGRARPDYLRLLPDGRVFTNRAAAKIRKRDRGYRYASEQLARFGAAPLRAGEDPKAWLERWLPAVTRTVKHPGNHKYAWMLDRKHRRHLPDSLPYPKVRTQGRHLVEMAA